MKNIVRVFSLAFSFALAAGAPASAWEAVYGPPASVEDGFRRVHPVPACGPFLNPGYIAVGTYDVGGVDPDVYVVYTDALGGPGWEATYDIEAGFLQDEGIAIVSVQGAGYVFLSNSLRGGWRPALTAIDCFGVVMWSQVYPGGTAGNSLRGSDLISTQSGDPAWGTAAGDFAVAGVWGNGGNDDAFLMRTDAIGNLIWNIAHNTNFPEAFHALAEAQPFGTSLTGDLVAVGRWNDYMGEQDALVARVSGNNGAIGPLPQCLQRHGQAGSIEVYNSVTRLQTIFPGQFAFAGTTTGPATVGFLEDIWVTRGNTCALLAQARFGNPVSPTSEHGHGIIEVLIPKAGAPAGSLAIAGDHGLAAGGPYEGALMVLNPALMPIAGSSWLFGDNGPNRETFYSLAEDPTAAWPGRGYILTGLTQTQWVPPPDPQDLYLVHHDPAAPFCGRGWSPRRVATSYPQITMPSGPVRPAAHTAVLTSSWNPSWDQQICP